MAASAEPRLRSGVESAGWQSGLVSQLSNLGRWLQGRFVVDPDPTDEVVPTERYLETDFLREALVRAGTIKTHASASPVTHEATDIDLRLAVSRFTRHYCGALSTTALVALARGVGLRLAPANCKVIVRNGVPFQLVFDAPEDEFRFCRERPPELPAGGSRIESLDELRRYVWRGLYVDHLAPLFELALTVTSVSPTLLWSNAAEWVGVISDAADECLGADGADPFVADREALLGADRLPGISGLNPMRGLLRWEQVDDKDFPHGVQVRKMCCITYLLPDRLGMLCQNCGFLPLRNRIALVREHRGMPMSSPPGPAERRSMEIGLKKIGL